MSSITKTSIAIIVAATAMIILTGGFLYRASVQKTVPSMQTPSSAEATPQDNPVSENDTEQKPRLVYVNDEFGFSLDLPAEWKGYKAVVLHQEKDERSSQTDDANFFYAGKTSVPLLAEIHIIVPSDKGESFSYFEKDQKITPFKGYVDKRNFIITKSVEWKNMMLENISKCIKANQIDCFTFEVNRLKTFVTENGRYMVFDDAGEYTREYWNTNVFDDPLYFSKEDRLHFNQTFFKESLSKE